MVHSNAEIDSEKTMPIRLEAGGGMNMGRCIVCANWTEEDFRIEYDHWKDCGKPEYLEKVRRNDEIHERLVKEKQRRNENETM